MKKLLIIFLVSFVLSVALASLKDGYVEIGYLTGFTITSFFWSIALGIGTAWCIVKSRDKTKPAYIVLAIWLGVSLSDLLFRIPEFSLSLISLPRLLIWWIGILIGYTYTILRNKSIRVLLLISSLFLLLWGSDSGYRLLLDKVTTKFFNGKVEYIKVPINLNDSNNESVNLRSLNGRYIILDFWTSSCDICF